MKNKEALTEKIERILRAEQPSPRELLAQDAVFYDAAGDCALELRRAIGDYQHVNKALAESRLRFVNSPRLLEVLAFKTLALCEIAARGVRVPRSFGFVAGKRVAFGVPPAASRAQKFVSKTVARGGVALHRGEGISPLKEFREPRDENELVQEFVWPPNEFKGFVKDLRVVIVGNRVAARYARRAPKPLPHSGGVASGKQFLTNAARGGVVEEFPQEFNRDATTLAFEARNALVAAAKKFGDSKASLDFCAVDFLVDSIGELFICEIEPCPDLRASQRATNAALDELALFLRKKSRRYWGLAPPRRVYVNGLNYLTEGIVRRLPEARPLVPQSERELVKKFLKK